MSTRLPYFAEMLMRSFTLALRLFPDSVQRDYGAEMQAVFRLKAVDAAQQSAWTLFTLACREARDMPIAILLAHFHTDRGGMMHPSFPSTSDQTPWPTAFLSLLPFFIAGTLRIILGYQPGWRPEQQSLMHFWFLLISFLIVAVGFTIGAAKKFPRWSYPYAVYSAFSAYTLSQYMVYLFKWNLGVRNNFFLILAVIAIFLWLPGLRSFYSNIAQDWTLLSYSFFGLVLYLLSTIDKDETPYLTLLVLLPSLLSLGAALAHLRIRSAYNRIVVLLVGVFASLFFWLLPIFQGMVTIWAGLAIGLFMLLGYGMILGAILLAPMLVKRAVHTWRASR